MKTTSKQTAVDFLKEKLTYVFVNDKSFNDLFEQAKAMEKMQILYAYECGFFDPQSNKDLLPLEGSEQYYKEIYESND